LHADGLVLPDSCDETFDRHDLEGDSDDEVRHEFMQNTIYFYLIETDTVVC